MSKVIVLIIISIMLIALPELLVSINTELLINSTANDGIHVMKNGMNDMIALISAMSYVAGFVFLIRSALAFKEYNENFYDCKKEFKKEDTEISRKKEEVIIKEENKKVEFTFNLDFENTSLNSKLSNIEKVIHSILSLPVLEENTENKILVYSTQEKYVKQVYNAYISIPKELRDKKIKSSSATILAMEQLILLENGLIKIENELLNQQLENLNIMNRFLQEKFPEQKSYITLNK